MNFNYGPLILFLKKGSDNCLNRLKSLNNDPNADKSLPHALRFCSNLAMVLSFASNGEIDLNENKILKDSILENYVRFLVDGCEEVISVLMINKAIAFSIQNIYTDLKKPII